MEFLRFGSSIPGSYWGCCAVCIIQDFKQHPDDKASIQLVDGDHGTPIQKKGEYVFLGPTYHDIFLSRLRIGTFSKEDMPNHTFLAVLTDRQLSSSTGLAWLKILKENGFEFIRTVDNSVYTGTNLDSPTIKTSSRKNYLFGLFRNVGTGSISDPLTPPSAWTDLPDPYEGDLSNDNMKKVQTKVWEKIGPAKFLTRAEVISSSAPVILAGKRSEFPQEAEYLRNQKLDAKKKKEEVKVSSSEKIDPFLVK